MAPDRSVWLCRLSYLPPFLIALVFTRFKVDLIQTLEATRMRGGLLPAPSLLLKQSLDFWYVVPVVCFGLFVFSFWVRRLASFQTIAAGYGLFSLLLAWQLFLSVVILSGIL